GGPRSTFASASPPSKLAAPPDPDPPRPSPFDDSTAGPHGAVLGWLSMNPLSSCPVPERCDEERRCPHILPVPGPGKRAAGDLQDTCDVMQIPAQSMHQIA